MISRLALWWVWIRSLIKLAPISSLGILCPRTLLAPTESVAQQSLALFQPSGTLYPHWKQLFKLHPLSQAFNHQTWETTDPGAFCWGEILSSLRYLWNRISHHPWKECPMSAVSSNACPRKNKTIRGWNQGLSWPERRWANILLSFSLYLTLSGTWDFCKWRCLFTVLVIMFTSCRYYVHECPEQTILASQIEWFYSPFSD